MPQLLYYLRPHRLDKADLDLDWGCVAVYTCSNSCTPRPGPPGGGGEAPAGGAAGGEWGYAEEFVWVQRQPS
jgi:hypothetical protein